MGSEGQQCGNHSRTCSGNTNSEALKTFALCHTCDTMLFFSPNCVTLVALKPCSVSFDLPKRLQPCAPLHRHTAMSAPSATFFTRMAINCEDKGLPAFLCVSKAAVSLHQ